MELKLLSETDSSDEEKMALFDSDNETKSSSGTKSQKSSKPLSLQAIISVSGHRVACFDLSNIDLHTNFDMLNQLPSGLTFS